MIRFRPADEADLTAVLSLLADDELTSGDRSAPTPESGLAAFRRMCAEGNNHLIVGERDGRVIATYQIAFITGFSLRATRRAQVESVRVGAAYRNQGIGAALMADAEDRARAGGCTLMQLTTNLSRTDAHRFYERLGFTPSHIGYKRDLT